MLNLLYKQELEEIVMIYEAHRNKLQREIEEKDKEQNNFWKPLLLWLIYHNKPEVFVFDL